MGIVDEVLGELENFHITREELEVSETVIITRLYFQRPYEL